MGSLDLLRSSCTETAHYITDYLQTLVTLQLYGNASEPLRGWGRIARVTNSAG